MNHLRYTLMPYIYSCAGLCWLKDRSMMKLLAFAYPEETAVFHIMDQYLFGEELMVCPVTEPMYYGENSAELTDTVKTRRNICRNRFLSVDFVRSIVKLQC